MTKKLPCVLCALCVVFFAAAQEAPAPSPAVEENSLEHDIAEAESSLPQPLQQDGSRRIRINSSRAAGEFDGIHRALRQAYEVMRRLHEETREAGAAMREELRGEILRRTPEEGSGRLNLGGDMQFVLDGEGTGASRLSVFRGGSMDLEQEVMRVDERGNLRLTGALMPRGGAFAEFHPVLEPVEEGDVLAADPNNPGWLRKASAPAEKTVVGIACPAAGAVLGAGIEKVMDMDPMLAQQMEEARRAGDRQAETAAWRKLEKLFRDRYAALAVAGIVLCKVDATFGPVGAGDLLVASANPGHAMRAANPASGSIVGKALEPLQMGTGLIRVLVMTR